MELVWPARIHLASYVDALERGWTPDNLRAEAGREELVRIRENPDAFLAQQVDREGLGPPIVLPDGKVVPRLPGFSRWMWDGAFCGVIGFRWQLGTAELPPHCFGQIGYAVVPWKRGRGYATRALALFLADVRKEGLPYVEITTDLTNLASQRVLRKAALVREREVVHGGVGHLLFRSD